MTAKQRANRERFKKAIAEAAKIRAKNPKLTQAEAVKKAWATIYKSPKKIGNAAKCRHVVCKKCGGVKSKIGATLNDVCSAKCVNAVKDQCECKCGGQFHKGNNSRELNKILNPKPKQGVLFGMKKTKKRPAKKTASHKDTKCHNVNIRVMSGVKVYGSPENILKEIEYWQKQVDKLRAEYKSEKGKIYKKSISQDIRMSKRWLEKYKRDLKNYLIKLK